MTIKNGNEAGDQEVAEEVVIIDGEEEVVEMIVVAVTGDGSKTCLDRISHSRIQF